MIYIKCNKDNVPHNYNFANAYYGFREMGAEIKFYKEIKDIYDIVTKDDIVIDYIDQIQWILDKFGCEYSFSNSPECLEKYMHRRVWHDNINNFASDESKWSKGLFIKPVKEKAFTGKIVRSIRDLIGCGSCYENYEILVSEPLDILAEYRGFMYYDELIDIRPYGSIQRTKDYMYHTYSVETLKEMVQDLQNWQDRPNAFSMDIAVANINGKEETVLVECNDCYALGCYGLQNIMYAKMISARWSQLMQRKDCYKF